MLSHYAHLEVIHITRRAREFVEPLLAEVGLMAAMYLRMTPRFGFVSRARRKVVNGIAGAILVV